MKSNQALLNNCVLKLLDFMPIGLEALKLREEAAQRTGVFDDLIVVSISDSHFIYSHVGMVLRNPA